MSEAVIKAVLTVYGPLALGWVVAVFLLAYIAKIHRTQKQDIERLHVQCADDYKDIIDKVHEGLENNTRVMSAIEVRLQERSNG